MSDHDSHGSTPAAWTTVILVTLAFVLGTVAVMMANWVLFAVACGVLVLGVIVGKAMQAAGLGKYPRGARA